MTTAITRSWSCGPSLPPVSCARRKRALTNRPSLGLSPVSRLFSPLSPDLFPPYDDYDDPTNHADPLVRSHGRQWSIPVAASGQFLMSLDTSATLRRHLPNFHVFHPSSPDPSSHSYYDELSTARHDLVGRQRPVLVAATVQFCCPPLFSFPCPLTLGPGGPCPHCEELVVVAELLSETSS